MEGGIKKLLEYDYTGGTSRLSYEQLQTLDVYLQQHTYLSSKEIKVHIGLHIQKDETSSRQSRQRKTSGVSERI
jgi:hypothetical protein